MEPGLLRFTLSAAVLLELLQIKMINKQINNYVNRSWVFANYCVGSVLSCSIESKTRFSKHFPQSVFLVYMAGVSFQTGHRTQRPVV